MKKLVCCCCLVFAFSILITPKVDAQCSVKISGNNALVCGESTQLSLESNWQMVNMNTTVNLQDVFFVNANIGYSCGDSGRILKTTNGGNSFQQQNTTTTKKLNALWFISIDTGIVVGESGVVLRTVDGGAHWVADSNITTANFTKLFFTGRQIGFAACDNGILYKTTDWGAHWMANNNLSFINGLYFTDSLNGYIASGNGVFKTNDGGNQWNAVYAYPTLNFLALTFLNKDTGFVSGMGGNGFIIKTENGGVTWTPSFTIQGLYAYKMAHDKFNNVYAVGNGIYKSSSLGNEWSALSIPSSTYFKSCSFINNVNGIVVGNSGAVYLNTSIDSIVWTPSINLSNPFIDNPIASPSVTTSYHVTGKINGCAVNEYFTIEVNPLKLSMVSNQLIDCNDTINLHFTVNANNKSKLRCKWFPSDFLNADSISDPVAVVKTDTRYKLVITAPNGCSDSLTTLVALNFDTKVSAQYNTLCGVPLQLNAQGGSLKEVSLNKSITAIKGLQGLNGDTFVLAANRRMYLSGNGGKSWGENFADTNYTIYGLCFRNSKLGYVASFSNQSMSGAILKTQNGGQSWSVISPSTSGFYNIPAVTFTSDLNGYCIGNPAKIFKTNNGGVSWISIPTNITSTLNALQFINDTIGYAVGESGNIIRTINAGISWQTINSPTNSVLRTVCFTSADTGFVAGYGNSIWKTTNQGNTWIPIQLYTDPNMSINTYQIIAVQGKGLFVAGSFYYINQPLGIEKGFVFQSTDNGNHWSRLTEDSVFSISSIQASKNGSVLIGGKGDNLLKLTPAPSWYSYSPAMGLSNPNQSDPVFNYPQSITYQLKSGIGSCFVTDTVNVNVKPMQLNVSDSLHIVCGDSAKFILNTLFIDIDASRYQSTWEIRNAAQQIVLSGTPNTRVMQYVALPSGSYTFKCRPKLLPPPLYFRIIPFYGDSISEIIYFTTDTVLVRSFQIPSTTGYQLFSQTPQEMISPFSVPKIYQVQIKGPSGCSTLDSVTIIPHSLQISQGADKSIFCGETIQLDTLVSNYTGAGPININWKPSNFMNDYATTSPIAFPNVSTSFQVTYKTNNGCMASDTVHVYVMPFSLTAIDTSMRCNDSAQLRIIQTYKGQNELIYRWSTSDQLSDSMIRNPIAKVKANKTYQIKATSWNGCIASDSLTLGITPPSPPSICIVGVSEFNFNEIIWNKGQNLNDTFYILKETNQTDNYQPIGSRNHNQIFIYVDSASNPAKQSNKYKLVLKDACNVTSNWSTAHKTMHLTINKGIGNSWNLIWNAYEGFSVQTYNIYRGTNLNNLAMIGTVSGSLTAFTDQDAPQGILYYQVELISPNSCFPGKTYNSSRSNKVSSAMAGDASIDGLVNQLLVYPNPSKEWLTVDWPKGKGWLLVVDAIGQTMISKSIEQTTKIQIAEWKTGFYVVQVIDQEGMKYVKFLKE